MLGLDVDVSLTTIAARVGRVHVVLSSILSQQPPPSRVVLHVSADPYLLDTGVRDLPKALAALVEASAGRLIVRQVENTGPYRKILPWLATHGDSDRFVVTADDDTVYPQGWLAGLCGAWRAGLVVAHSAHPVVVEGGHIAPYRRWLAERTGEGATAMALPVGKDGVLYRASDFPPEVMDINEAMRIAQTGDDLWLRWHLARCGIAVTVVGRGRLPEVGGAQDSLWRGFNRGGGNDRMIAALEADFAARYGFTMAGLGQA